MIFVLDGLSIAGLVLFFRIPFVIQSLYAADLWVTAEPVPKLKPWEGVAL